MRLNAHRGLGHYAVEVMMPSPDPRAHKSIVRGASSFDNAIWDHQRKTAVSDGTLIKVPHHPVMKQHSPRTGMNGRPKPVL